MVTVRGACDKPFWIYRRLNNCAAPAPGRNDVLVVAPLACPAHKKMLPPLISHANWSYHLSLELINEVSRIIEKLPYADDGWVVADYIYIFKELYTF